MVFIKFKNTSNVFTYIAVYSVNLMAYAIGSAFSWSSPVIPKIKEASPENPLSQPATTLEIAWIASLLSLSATVGPLISGISSEKLGRKKTLLIFAIPMLIAHLILPFSRSIELFLFAQFLLGIGSGCILSVLPIYVGEISEKSNRGFTSFCITLAITLGTLFSYVVGPYVTIQVLSFLSIIPIVLFFLIFGLLIPESPYYLIYINRTDLAIQALQKLRGKSKDEIDKELLEIINNVQISKLNKIEIKNLFRSKILLKGLMISCGIMAIQGFSGSTAIRSYMQPILSEATTTIKPELAVNVIGVIQFLATLGAAQFVDRVGRRILLLFSTAGSCLSLIILGIYFYLKTQNFNVDSLSWLPIVSLIAYVISFTSGLGPISWTVIGELFAANVKSFASAVTTFVCLFITFLVTLCFPLLSESIGRAGTFWICSSCCAVGFVFCKICMIETKGKSFQEIQDLLDTKEVQK